MQLCSQLSEFSILEVNHGLETRSILFQAFDVAEKQIGMFAFGHLGTISIDLLLKRQAASFQRLLVTLSIGEAKVRAMLSERTRTVFTMS